MRIFQFTTKHRAIDIILLLGLNVFCHRGWFRPGIIEYGDWSYYPKDFLMDLLAWPFCWTSRFFTGPLFILDSWPLQWMMGFIANLGFDFGVAERIVYLFPCLILSVIGIYYFTYVLFKKRVICFFSTLFFIFNIYALMLLAGGLFSRMVAYALMPLILAFFVKGKREGTFATYLLCGLLLALSTFYDSRVAYLIVIVMFLFFAQHIIELIIDKKVKSLKNMAMPFVYLSVVLAVPLILNFYWIYPTFVSKATYMPSGYELSGWVKVLSYFKLSHCLAVYLPWWPPGSTGFPQQVRLIYYLIPVLVFMAIVFRLKDAKVRLLTFLAVISVLLTMGANPPLGNVYIWAFKYFPGFNAFRDPGKFYTLICLAYAPLLGVSIDAIASKLGRVDFKRLRVHIKKEYQKPIFLFVMFFILIYLVWPAMTEKIGGTFTGHPMPKEYKKIEEFIKNQPDSFRTFWRPYHGRFSFYSENYPLIRGHYSPIFIHFFLNDIHNINAFKNTKHIAKVLGLLNVKYCFLPLEKEYLIGIDKDFYLSTFQQQIGLKKLDIGENIDIYENKYVAPRFFATPHSALIVGGRKALLQLASLEDMDLSRWALYFADELKDFNIDLLNRIECIIFNDRGIDDFILASIGNKYRFDLSQYAIRADDATPRRWQQITLFPADIYGTLYGELIHNKRGAIYAHPHWPCELTRPVMVDIKEPDTYEVWLRATMGPDRGKLSIWKSKDLENYTHTFYEDFENRQWKKRVYSYRGLRNLYNKTLVGYDSKRRHTGELIYKIEAPSPIGKMWMEWDTLFLNESRIGRFFVSGDCKDWIRVGEDQIVDVHPYRVDITNFVKGKKVCYIKFQIENKIGAGSGAITKTGYHYETISTKEILRDKDLKDNNPRFKWIKADSVYLDKGRTYFRIINKDGIGMLDQLVIIPSRVINRLREAIAEALQSKDVVVIKTCDGFTSDASIPVAGKYRIAANVMTDNFLGRLGLLLEDSNLKEINVSNKKELFWIESDPIEISKGVSKISLIERGEGKVSLERLILYKTKRPISSVEKFFESKESNPVVWQQINPTKYKVKLKSGKPTYLVFSEGFDPRWTLNLDDPVQSISAYSMINSFFIPKPGEIDTTLEFTPQRYVYKGLWVSGIGLALICFYFFCQGVGLLVKKRQN